MSDKTVIMSYQMVIMSEIVGYNTIGIVFEE